MKPFLSLLLAVSLAANATLAYFAFSGSSRLTAELNAQAAAAQAAATKARAPAARAPVEADTWARLKTDELSALAPRLRAAGFPPEVIRTMMSALVAEHFAARRRALDPDAATRAFWKTARPDPALQLAQNQLYREQEKMLRDLLGPGGRTTDPLALARLRSRFGNLSPEKLDAAQLIESDFIQKRTEFYLTKGSYSSADLAPLEREQRTALAAILSPAELEEFDLRSSRTGQSMRTDLSAFEPTEQEFRAIFPLRQAFDERYPNTSGIPSQEQMRERSEAQKQLNAQITALLGPARGAEYERMTDYNYRQTSHLVARYELPPATTLNLWTTQKEFERRRNEIYAAGANTAPELRQMQLNALQQEAIARVTPLLGDASRVEAYKQYGGSWLQSLIPRPRPPN
ncbi:MAG: hypothetical protein JNK23_01110 [Opitutaceae bacterium]|nr:hypothetical protein [Opitutaceae bacterium]